ncbi:MAG: alpha/beta fold hydrolase [Hydrogenophaga sp.]|jgi:pimeloyl-ACP methyl ester carboxylesterase|uniref:alpha/beta fold hydrolase n=1 Tax=Hydrogenophaga sp. TaxID=1904254 RepID=UPI0027273B61|nr:alpha/beta fold hydrolase [Hydrogenophaga sp.]MDO9506658.1 alpha/beta fold hydrolase [Hydrogenophaga sp.]MDP3204321.1 alpha/beta fold hydrolase [Hydrogenophaga sp.]MDP3628176.1 alpha/beta fold hydrolase [Hydrogenophaga sp.]
MNWKTASLLAALGSVVLLLFWLWTPDKPRSELEVRYLAAPGDMLQVGPWRLHVRDSGPRDAPAVVMLHGFGASLHTWEAWAQALSATHRVIRLDLPGSGLSEPDSANDYTDARSLQLVLALMDQLGVSRASIVGHSIGGRIAWTLAARHPERTERLVLVAPDGFASPGFEYGQVAKVPAVLGAMRYVMPKAVLRMNLAPAYADPAFLTDELTTRYHDLMLAPGARDAMFKRLEQTVLTNPVPLLNTITAPTLLLWGAADAMIPVTNAQDYLGAVKGSRLVTLPGVGHLPHEEAAQASLQAVADFLR